MQTICAWCSAVIEDGDPTIPPSHGLCEECEKQFGNDIEIVERENGRVQGKIRLHELLGKDRADEQEPERAGESNGPDPPRSD